MSALSDEKYLEMAHRMATTYRHDADGPGLHHYGFQRHTLLDFSRAVAESAVRAEREGAEPVLQMKLSDYGSGVRTVHYRQLETDHLSLGVHNLFTHPPQASATVPEGWNEVMDMLTGFDPIVMTSSSYGGSVFRVELGFRNLVDRNKGHDFLLKLIHFRDLLASTKQSGGEG